MVDVVCIVPIERRQLGGLDRRADSSKTPCSGVRGRPTRDRSVDQHSLFAVRARVDIGIFYTRKGGCCHIDWCWWCPTDTMLLAEGHFIVYRRVLVGSISLSHLCDWPAAGYERRVPVQHELDARRRAFSVDDDLQHCAVIAWGALLGAFVGSGIQSVDDIPMYFVIVGSFVTFATLLYALTIKGESTVHTRSEEIASGEPDEAAPFAT